MKKITLITLMLFTAFGYAQVGINTNTPDASSALEIESTTGGILIPRMTETQRDAIVSPASGLMIYQTDQEFGFYFYNGTLWTKIDGVAGPAGADGADGADGAQGPQGPIGPAGSQGLAGADGVDGAQGPVGPAGPAGADGADGAEGPAGADGAQGLQGPAGPAGADGVDGVQGPVGPAGADGEDGAQGPQGLIGPDGVDGAQGPQGLIGPDGVDGAQGPVGPAGVDGVDGAQGPVGPAGVDGATLQEVTDEFTASSGQTSFTLTQTPSSLSKIKMYINGIRISNTAYSWTGTTLTYTSANNGNYTLSASDRVQMDYTY